MLNLALSSLYPFSPLGPPAPRHSHQGPVARRFHPFLLHGLLPERAHGRCLHEDRKEWTDPRLLPAQRVAQSAGVHGGICCVCGLCSIDFPSKWRLGPHFRDLTSLLLMSLFPLSLSHCFRTMHLLRPKQWEKMSSPVRASAWATMPSGPMRGNDSSSCKGSGIFTSRQLERKRGMDDEDKRGKLQCRYGWTERRRLSKRRIKAIRKQQITKSTLTVIQVSFFFI